jgi:GT2 family glycosyltransferase
VPGRGRTLAPVSTSSEPPAIDVSIVAFGSAERLRALLPALVRHPAIRTVVVVDHGDGGSAGVAAELGATAVHDPANPGFGAGQNHGRRLTRAPFLLVLNPDLTVDVDAVTAAVDAFDEPLVAAVQGVIVNETTGAPERSRGRSIRPVHLWGRLVHARSLLRLRVVRAAARHVPLLRDHVERVPPRVLDVEWLAATAVLFRRDALDDVGGFDEQFFLYGEDLDLCRRLTDRGWRLLASPDVWAHHASGESSGDRWRRELVWWEGTLRFACLHWSGGSWALGASAGAARAVTLALRHPSRSLDVVRRLVVDPVRRRRAARVPS